MEKENWIEGILNSADHNIPAKPDAALFARIQIRISEHEIVSPKWIWLAAASIAALLLLNAKVVLNKNKRTKNPIESVAASLSESNQLY